MFLIAYFLAKTALIDPWWLQVLFWLAVVDGVVLAVELLSRCYEGVMWLVSIVGEFG